MFASRGDNMPALSSFAAAKAFMDKTKPMKSGPNKGTIPLHLGRRQPDVYSIRMETGRHEMQADWEKPQWVIRCRYHYTDIVSFYEDGAVEIDGSYDTSSTNSNQSAILECLCRVTTHSARKAVMIDRRNMYETPMNNMFRMSERGDWSLFPFTLGQSIVLLPMPNRQYIVCGHGYYAAPQRSYHDKLVGKFIRQVQSQLRALYRMSSREYSHNRKEKCFLDVFEGEHAAVDSTSADFSSAHRIIHSMIADCGWKPGEQVPSDVINQMLSEFQSGWRWGRYNPTLNTYLDRMNHWAALRFDLRDVSSNYNPQGWEVLDEKAAVALRNNIEKAQAGGFAGE